MINELTSGRAGQGHGRLVLCTAVSTLAVAAGLSLFDWPPRGRYAIEPVPAAFDVLLARESVRPLPEPARDPQAEQPEAAERNDEAPAAGSSAENTEEEQDEAAAASTDGQDDPDRQIDWQASLERASAETVEAHNTPDSLHPLFDELRRVAAVRYAPPRTGKPPPIWENVEDDIYGRKILRHGDCFRVIDDMNVGNRYAFETFEKYLLSCEWRGEARQEFPWIETIVARYPYLREPDGGLAAIDKD